jgi:hypothetical protein
MITPQNPAVLVRDFKSDKTFIITRSDVIQGAVTTAVRMSGFYQGFCPTLKADHYVRLAISFGR